MDRGVLLPAIGGVFLIGLVAFAYFAGDVGNFPGEVLISTLIQSWRTPWMDATMKAVSVLGVFAVALSLALFTSFALFIIGWRVESALVLFTTVVGRLITLVLKEVVGRPRPTGDVVQVLQEVDSYSFPSGHVMHYTIFCGIIALVLMAKLEPRPMLRVVLVTFLLVPVAIGFSRIYLGVHWLGDVVSGYAFGVAVVAGAILLWRRYNTQKT